MQVDPAERRDVERRLRDQRAVGDHRAAVRADLAQALLERGVARPGRGEHLQARLGGAPGHRARLHLPAAARARVGPGHHGDHVVP